MAKHSYGDVDQNHETSMVGGMSPVLRHMDSLILELASTGTARAPRTPHQAATAVLKIKPHTCEQEAVSKVAVLNARLKGRRGARDQVKERDKYRANDLRARCEARRRRRE